MRSQRAGVGQKAGYLGLGELELLYHDGSHCPKSCRLRVAPCSVPCRYYGIQRRGLQSPSVISVAIRRTARYRLNAATTMASGSGGLPD